MSENWFESFFSGLVVEFWQAAAPAPSETEMDFLQSCFGASDGKQLLDVACGGGRHSIPLARRGYGVTGLDISTEFLHAAREAAGGLPIEWVEMDMRRIEWMNRFDGALCFGNSFGYLERSDTRGFIRRLAAALKPGAVFVLETGIAAESLLPDLHDDRWMELGDILFFSQARYEVEQSRLRIRYSFIKDGVRETKEEAVSHVYTVGELVELFAAAGIRVTSLLGSTGGEPFRVGSQRLVLVAQKEG